VFRVTGDYSRHLLSLPIWNRQRDPALSVLDNSGARRLCPVLFACEVTGAAPHWRAFSDCGVYGKTATRYSFRYMANSMMGTIRLKLLKELARPRGRF
jgi:hypothetical protein